MTVTNPGSSAISGWTVRFSFADGQQVTQYWGGQLDQEGAEVTATNEAWNGDLGPGAAAAFGFLASGNGTNPVPVPGCEAG